MRRSTIFWGLLIILAGILLLFDNLGLLPFSVWAIIGPVFLIALGVWVLWGVLFGRKMVEEQIAIPLQDARRARIILNHGAGRLTVDGTAAAGELLAGSFTGGVDYKTRQRGETLEVNLRVNEPTLFWAWPMEGGLNWTFGLNRGVPMTFEVNAGAGEAHLDLSELQVTELHIKTGASSTRLILPSNAGMTRAIIESGVSSVSVLVPENVAARIRTESGLADVHIDRNRFPRTAGVYQSPDYDTAKNKIDMDIKTGVGSVSVR